MTSHDSEWLACADPYPMLEYLEGKASDRKLMLFSVACLRRIWHLISDPRSRNVVEATERFADDAAGPSRARPLLLLTPPSRRPTKMTRSKMEPVILRARLSRMSRALVMRQQ
jgi:hypothetical protein